MEVTGRFVTRHGIVVGGRDNGGLSFGTMRVRLATVRGLCNEVWGLCSDVYGM